MRDRDASGTKARPDMASGLWLSMDCKGTHRDHNINTELAISVHLWCVMTAGTVSVAFFKGAQHKYNYYTFGTFLFSIPFIRWSVRHNWGN